MSYELWIMRDEGWIMRDEGWVMRDECGVKSWSWNILLYEEILHYAVLRSEWQGYVFCSRLGIYIIGEIHSLWSDVVKDEGWRMRDEGWRMRGEGCGVRSAGCEYSITKFTEMWWNDSVFEGSEEHRRCSGKVTDFRLAAVEKLFPLWRDSSLCYASFRMTGLCFLLTIRNLIIGEIVYETQRFFFLNCFF